VENYRFDYFSDIEEHFCRRRGTTLIGSTLDWSVMESWKDAGVPLEAVLRGIDAAFDKYDRRPSKTRKINSLAYCAQQVLAAAEQMKEAAVGSVREARDEGLERQRVAAFLERNAKAFELAAVPDAARKLVGEDAPKLKELAKQIGGQSNFSLEDFSLEVLERRLTVMEEKLFAALLTSSPDDLLVEIRAQAERELAPYRSKMTGPQIDQLLKQYTNKRLLDHYKLPRLSLFYM
jgi:hypothetical protein